MSEKTKKIFLIIVFILITIFFALALYFLFFRDFIAPPETEIPTVTPPITGLPTIPPAVNLPPDIVNAPAGVLPTIPSIPPTPLIAGPTLSFKATGGITSLDTLETNKTKNPTIAANGKDLVYYDTETGFFYSMTPDGEKKLFSTQTFKNVEQVTWASNTQKAILEYPDGSNIIYDFKQQKSITLPAQWEDFTFSNNNNNIAFKDMRLDPENRYLSTASVNGTGFRQIEPIGNKDDDVHVTWAPNNKYVALYSESIDADRAEIFPIGFHGENFRKFRVEGRDLRFEWSPTGSKLLYSAYNSRSDYKPSLWLVNSSPELLATGRTKVEINTWADKCTFPDENTVYCAVPRTLETGVGFRPEIADNTPDDIYKINVSTGTKELIAQPLFPSTVEQLIISEDQKYLYWLEKSTGQLKKINL